MQRMPPAVCDADLPPSSDINFSEYTRGKADLVPDTRSLNNSSEAVSGNQRCESSGTARTNCRMPTPGLIKRRRGLTYQLDPLKITWKTETHADVERGSPMSGSDTGDESPLPYSPYIEKSPATYIEDKKGHADASGGSELLSNLKVVRIDRFLWMRKLLMLAIIFSVSLSTIFALFMSLPKINSAEVGLEMARGGAGQGNGDVLGIEMVVDPNPQLLLRFPKNMTELRVIRGALEEYQKEHRRQVQVGIVFLYLFLQTFMIPGTIFINVLAGSLYGFYEALFLVLVLAGSGSSLCYCLSNFILKEIVYYYFPERCEWLAREVHRHRHNLLNYMLFLRVTPILPNWFINVSSPLVGVPYRDFAIGTTVGLIPASVVGVKAGGILSTINSLGDLYDFWTIATFSIIAVLVLLPVIIKGRCNGVFLLCLKLHFHAFVESGVNVAITLSDFILERSFTDFIALDKPAVTSVQGPHSWSNSGSYPRNTPIVSIGDKGDLRVFLVGPDGLKMSN
ncbi:hypothetical protein R1flu_008949 [Riccia fluitans]|uniref:VTT domain-containing protein n=1 Tax=Riccia fluitans TaxID=41844 RepID=A0ABD1Z3P5_9MARC